MGGRKDVTGAAIDIVGAAYAVCGIAVMGIPTIEVPSVGAPGMTVAPTGTALEVDMIT